MFVVQFLPVKETKCLPVAAQITSHESYCNKLFHFLFLRSFLHSLRVVFVHLWHPALLPGDLSGSVHQPGRNHMLEENLPAL